MQPLSWYARRLARMSILEVGHRIVRALTIRLEGANLSGTIRSPTPKMDGAKHYSLLGQRCINRAACIKEADILLTGELKVFAVTQTQAATSHEWNRDPLTGKLAPLEFGKSLDYRDEQLVGNIKYLWEPNRHLELVVLAQAFAATEDARYLQGLGQRVDTWLTQCPYRYGVTWSSALEVGIRLVNWSLVWQLIGGLESKLFEGVAGAELRRRWLDSIYQHGHFVRHYYSRHSSANNHLIGEAAGVFIASCTWPYWNDFEKWGRHAQQILIDEVVTQTHPDGVNREQAVAYQQFVLDFFILAALAGRAAGMEFPRDYWKTLERMLEYIHAVMDVGGNVPMIGDADDGFVVRLSQEADFCPFRSLLATGAILFDRPDFAAKSGGLDDKTRFLLGDDRWSGLVAETGPAVREGRRSFPAGGYYVLGHQLETLDETRLVADAGPLGYLSIAAHGHADALSFVLSVGGREILVDPGTYSYHTEPLWREYFRGTGAHNTVRVDGADQSVQGGNFMWLRHAKARCETFEFDDKGSRFIAEHDGYTRLADPLVHQRRIIQQESMIEVIDRLDCSSYHTAERCWHFSEQCRVSLEGTTVVAENGPVRVTLRPIETDCEIRHLRGSDDPPGGWVSRRFDVKVPSDSVFFTSRIEGTTELQTRIECEIRVG